jgi:coenzyme F420-reducing hydrogenase delta subunit
LILKLKTELEKTIEKNKISEANSKQFEEDIKNLQAQIDNLKAELLERSNQSENKQ